MQANNRISTFRLILIPGLLGLAITLLRLVGELRHWSEKWFSTATGGIEPSGMSWLIGITWLPLPFGIYFALKRLASQQKPAQPSKVLLYPGLAFVLVLALNFFGHLIPVSFPNVRIVYSSVMATAAGIAWRGWPQLGRVMCAYGFATRIPVVILMFFAMLGKWGTHYDYVGMPASFHMSFWPGFFWLVFLPQLFFWIGFTIVMGTLTGGIAASIVLRKRHAVLTSSVFS